MWLRKKRQEYRERARRLELERKEALYGKTATRLSASITRYPLNWDHWMNTGGEDSRTDDYFKKLVSDIKELQNDNS